VPHTFFTLQLTSNKKRYEKLISLKLSDNSLINSEDFKAHWNILG